MKQPILDFRNFVFQAQNNTKVSFERIKQYIYSAFLHAHFSGFFDFFSSLLNVMSAGYAEKTAN